MSKETRNSKGRVSLLPEPVRVRLNDDNNPRSSSANRFSLGRPSVGTAGQRRTSAAGQRKSYLAGSKGSGVGNVQKTRLSSGYGRGGFARSDVMKDPRPISDKAYIHRCIKSLYEYLIENGYPHAISPKILQSPQSKDFFRIFEFLFSKFYDPKYKLGPKPEEEIPQMMKMVTYRFNITKSSLYTIGTAHTWPHLLACLTWLQDGLKIRDRASEDIESMMFPHDEDNFDGIPTPQILMNYTGKAYFAFLCGKDSYEEEDEELKSILSQNLIGSASDLETLEAENRRLEQELAMLEQNPDKVAALEVELEGYKTDEHNFSKYLEELELHMSDQQKLLADSEEERLALLAELKAARDNNDEMQAICESQEFSPADVERMKQDFQSMKEVVSSVEREIECLDSDIWEREITVGKKRTQTEEKCHEYNRMAQLLQLIPSNAENARGRDLEMKISFGSESDSSYETCIKPAILELKAEFNERAKAQEDIAITLLDTLEQGMELKIEKQEALEMKETKLKRIEEDLNCKKEVYQRDLQFIMKQTEETEEALVQLERSGRGSSEELKKELDDAQKQLEQSITQAAKKESEYAEFLGSIGQMALDHKKKIKAGLQQKYEEMQKIHEEVLKNANIQLFPDGTFP